MSKQKVTLGLICLTIAAVMGFTDQENFAARLRQKLSLYYLRHVPSKVYFTFNQPKYTPGDTAYFRLNFFKASGHLPIKGRQIINCQLISPSGTAVFTSQVLIVDGSGANQIPIPESALPGRYTVIAFSDAMKNSNASLYSKTSFWIAGPNKLVDLAEENLFKLYPEGGHLVEGIVNKVVVKGPPNVSGAIKSSAGTDIASFSTNLHGFGLFFLTPRNSEKYFAEIPERQLKVALPEIKNDGVGIMASAPTNQAPIRVTVQVPPHSSMKSQPLVLSLTVQDKVYYTAELNFSNKTFATFALPQSNLPDGVAQLTIFKQDGGVVAERLLFIFNPVSIRSEINVTKKAFGVREMIKMQIRVADSSSVPLPAAFAVTVTNHDLLDIEDRGSENVVINSLLLSDVDAASEFPPGLSVRDPEALFDIDNFLITQRWNGFHWRDVWDETLPTHPFRGYIHLTGRVELTDGKPLPDSTRVTFFLQQSVMTYEMTLHSSGRFNFPLLMDFAGEEEVFYHVESYRKVLDNAKVIVDADYPVQTELQPSKRLNEADEFFTYARNKRQIDRSYEFYLKAKSYKHPPSLNTLVEEEVFGADISIRLDDYLLFPTMSETLREVIPMVQHRRIKNRDVVRVFFDDRNIFAEDEPLYIVDGVLTDHTAYFLSLKPSDVASIKVINSFDKLRSFSAIGKNGMILVETKIPENNRMVPRSDHTFILKGLNPPSPSNTLGLSYKNPRVPDLRSTLYWNADLRTDESGKIDLSFPASDDCGNFKVKVEGFTADGKPFFAEESFSVSYPRN